MDFILSTLQAIGILLLVVLVFNLIILVHEWGHFLAARWRGLRVDKFQIWFGKPLWKKTINGVQYGLGSIPAGGFVALPQMAPMELLEGQTDRDGEKLQPISALDKSIVAFAGPLFSFLLAVVLAVLVWMIGYPQSRAANSTTIGVVMADSGAEKAGLQPGDEILRVDGNPVDTFSGMVDSVLWAVVASENDEIEFVFRRDGEVRTAIVEAPIPRLDDEIPWFRRLFTRPALRQAGIGPEQTPVIVGSVMEPSPAESVGLKTGDIITHLDGEPLLNFMAVSQHIERTGGAPLTLTVERDGETLQLQATPKTPDNPGDVDPKNLGPMLGFGPLQEDQRDEAQRDVKIQHVPPRVQIQTVLRTMWNTITAVASPKSGVGPSHLSGPLGIMDVYYQLFQSPDGWRLVLWFSVLLNINLAILNLLPFPILDGGHITMAVIEGATRRPINLRILEALNAACAILLMGFMLWITGFDAGGILSRDGGDRELPSFSPEQF